MQAEAAGRGQRRQQRVDARAVAAHGDDLQRRAVAHRRGEVLPVQAAVVAADQQRDAASAEAFQCRQRGVRRGANRVVDIGDAVALAQGLQAVRQRPEIRRGRRQCRRVQAQRLDRRQHRAQVAAVVPARQRHPRAVEHRHLAAVHDSAAHMPAVFAIEPTHLAIGQRQRGQVRIGGVEQRDTRPRPGHQRQLVFDVARLAAVPVQMFREQVQHQRQLRPRAAAGDVAGLVAG